MYICGIEVCNRKSSILLPKLISSIVRKKCSSELLKFKAGGQEFAIILRSLEQFIQTVNSENNFWFFASHKEFEKDSELLCKINFLSFIDM